MSTEPIIKQSSQEKPNKWLPLGMIFLLVYIAIGILGSFMIFINPVLVIGIYSLTGLAAYIHQMILVGVLITSFIGIIKKKLLGKKYLTYYLTYMIAYSIFHYISFLLYPQEVTEVLNKSLPTPQFTYGDTFMQIILAATFAFSLLLNLFIIYYLNKKRDLFTN